MGVNLDDRRRTWSVVRVVKMQKKEAKAEARGAKQPAPSPHLYESQYLLVYRGMSCLSFNRSDSYTPHVAY